MRGCVLVVSHEGLCIGSFTWRVVYWWLPMRGRLYIGCFTQNNYIYQPECWPFLCSCSCYIVGSPLKPALQANPPEILCPWEADRCGEIHRCYHPLYCLLAIDYCSSVWRDLQYGTSRYIFGCNSAHTQHKKASNHHANLPLEMYSFTL